VWIGTSGHGLAGMGVLGWWLDLTVLEVFSSLNDSMVNSLCGHIRQVHQARETMLSKKPDSPKKTGDAVF